MDIISEDSASEISRSLGVRLNVHECQRILAITGGSMDASKIKEALMTKSFVGPERLGYECSVREVFSVLRRALLHRAKLSSGDNMLKKAFLLLSDSRSPNLTRSQLRASCLSRLNVFLSDEQADLIFNELDKDREGVVKVRALASTLLLGSPEGHNEGDHLGSSLEMPSQRQNKGEKRRGETGGNNEGIKQPTRTINFSTKDLEQMIIDRVIALTTSKSLVQSLGIFFAESSNINSSRADSITKDEGILRGIDRSQMKLSLWKKLKIPASEETIEKIFKKYDPSGTGYIPMQSWVKGIIVNEAERMQLRPLQDSFVPAPGQAKYVKQSTGSVDRTEEQRQPTLKSGSVPPGKVEQILYEKIQERGSSAQMHRFFIEPGLEKSRTISKTGIYNVLRMFDIFLTTQDFDSFFLANDRGDGLIDVRKFVDKITPKFSLADNPIVPKDSQVLKKENELAKQLFQLTGKCRVVSALNGPPGARFTTNSTSSAVSATTTTSTSNGSVGNATEIMGGWNRTGNESREGETNSGKMEQQYTNENSFAREQQLYQKQLQDYEESQLLYLRQLKEYQDYHQKQQDRQCLPVVTTPSAAKATATEVTLSKATNLKKSRVQRRPMSAPVREREGNSTKSLSPEKFVSEALKQRIMTELLATQREKRAELYLRKAGSRPSTPSRFASTEGSRFDNNNANAKTKNSQIVTAKDIFEGSAPPMPYTFVYSPRSQVGSGDGGVIETDRGGGNTEGDSMGSRQGSRPRSRSRSREKKFVNSGQHWTISMDPFHRTLLTRYKSTNENITKSSQAYGLFIKSLNNAQIQRNALEKEFLEAKANTTQQQQFTARRPQTSGASSSSARSSPKKAFIKL